MCRKVADFDFIIHAGVTLLEPPSQIICPDAPSAEAVYLFQASEFLVLGTWRSLVENLLGSRFRRRRLYMACSTDIVGGKVTMSVTRAMMFVVLSDIAEINMLIMCGCDGGVLFCKNLVYADNTLIMCSCDWVRR
jgi:hypothetical protein